jgi:hypothetical protein
MWIILSFFFFVIWGLPGRHTFTVGSPYMTLIVMTVYWARIAVIMYRLMSPLSQKSVIVKPYLISNSPNDERV